jgi:hypothetical protein
MIDKFNRGLVSIPTPTPPPPTPVYLTYDGKHFWCGDKIVDIVMSKNLVRVNNKYRSSLEANGKPFINQKMVFIYNNKLLSYGGKVYTCTRDKNYVHHCDANEVESWEPFKE